MRIIKGKRTHSSCIIRYYYSFLLRVSNKTNRMHRLATVKLPKLAMPIGLLCVATINKKKTAHRGAGYKQCGKWYQ